MVASAASMAAAPVRGGTEGESFTAQIISRHAAIQRVFAALPDDPPFLWITLWVSPPAFEGGLWIDWHLSGLQKI
jgi:hypothetical protein